jgi:hypothetical protein
LSTAASNTEAKTSAFEALESKTNELEQDAKWLQAAELCRSFLGSAEQSRAEAFELLADSLYNAAFQQDTRAGFQLLIVEAKDAYEKSCAISQGNDLSLKRRKARAGFCMFQASDDTQTRRRIISEECINPLRQVCMHERLEGISRPVSKIDSEYLRYLLAACHISNDPVELSRLARESRQLGKFILPRIQNDAENYIQIANAYVLFLDWASGYFLDASDLKELSRELQPALKSLIELSKAEKNKHLSSLALETAGLIAVDFVSELDLGISLLENSISNGRSTGDTLQIGRQFSALANALLWAQQNEDLVDRRKEILQRAAEFSMEANKSLKVSLVSFYVSFAYSLQVCALTELAKNETDISVKQDLLNKAIELGREGMSFATNSSLDFLSNRLSDALRAKEETIEDVEGKAKILNEAIEIIVHHLKQTEPLVTESSWNLGLSFRDAGELYAKLADNEPTGQKSTLLRHSVDMLKRAIGILLKTAEMGGQAGSLALTFEDLGNSLVRLYEETGEREYSAEALDAYDRTIEYYDKMNSDGSLTHITVYVLTKVATLCDRLGDFERSAKFYGRAAGACKLAASAQSENLRRSFEGLASFCSGNALIEEARLHHRDEDFDQAVQKLKDAALEFDKNEEYRYLAKHYLACSKAEEGENSSRKEQNLEASEAFENAAELFLKSQEDILVSIAGMPSEVADKVKSWAEFSSSRSRYCRARKILAQAKSLDNQGMSEESMHKYLSAAKNFRDLENERTSEDPDELEALAISCDAWASMKEAEYRSSPALYTRAASLFLKAKDKKARKSFVLSCLANAAICRALEAGTRFKQGGEIALYSDIKKQLASAAQFYEEAGFDRAADWTSATGALFDALAYISSAESEMDPKNKTQMYHRAQKSLELSAKRYDESGFQKKKEEVLKQLKKVKESKEILLTPVEALSQNPTSYSSPSNFTADQASVDTIPTSGMAANIGVSTTTPNVGSSIRIDLDIANVGRSPILLMKLDNLAPDTAFEPETEKETHHFLLGKDTISIDMKGRRLEYMKTLELSIHLRVKSRGTYILKPRILFVDEAGKYRPYDLEPQTIEAKELGFMGWAKGK